MRVQRFYVCRALVLAVLISGLASCAECEFAGKSDILTDEWLGLVESIREAYGIAGIEPVNSVPVYDDASIEYVFLLNEEVPVHTTKYNFIILRQRDGVRPRLFDIYISYFDKTGYEFGHRTEGHDFPTPTLWSRHAMIDLLAKPDGVERKASHKTNDGHYLVMHYSVQEGANRDPLTSILSGILDVTSKRSRVEEGEGSALK